MRDVHFGHPRHGWRENGIAKPFRYIRIYSAPNAAAKSEAASHSSERQSAAVGRRCRRLDAITGCAIAADENRTMPRAAAGYRQPILVSRGAANRQAVLQGDVAANGLSFFDPNTVAGTAGVTENPVSSAC